MFLLTLSGGTRGQSGYTSGGGLILVLMLLVQGHQLTVIDSFIFGHSTLLNRCASQNFTGSY